MCCCVAILELWNNPNEMIENSTLVTRGSLAHPEEIEECGRLEGVAGNSIHLIVAVPVDFASEGEKTLAGEGAKVFVSGHGKVTKGISVRTSPNDDMPVNDVEAANAELSDGRIATPLTNPIEVVLGNVPHLKRTRPVAGLRLAEPFRKSGGHAFSDSDSNQIDVALAIPEIPANPAPVGEYDTDGVSSGLHDPFDRGPNPLLAGVAVHLRLSISGK
jgi:hypothetical protein